MRLVGHIVRVLLKAKDHRWSRINKIIGGTPILSGLNRMAGMVLGLLIGCAMIWVFMIIAGVAFGSSYDNMIAGNPVLEFIDSHNLITTIITK